MADEELEEGLENILKGNYEVVSRLKLKTTINKKRLPDAVNEAVVHTAHIAKIRHFQVFVDRRAGGERQGGRDHHLHTDRLDLLCDERRGAFGRPAGGGAGHRSDGPVQVRRAPDRRSRRSSKITLKVVRPKECVVVVDGQEEEAMAGNETVEFGVSETKARFVSFGRSFYSRTHEKLMGSLC